MDAEDHLSAEDNSLTSLPEDALARVCSYLTQTRDLNNVLCTCRTLHQLRHNTQLQATWLIRTKGRNTALRAACRAGMPGAVKFIINSIKPGYQAFVVNQQDALHKACWEPPLAGQAKVVHTILKVPGVDINKIDKYGNTALHLACSAGNVEAVQQLLAVPGIRPDICSRQGDTPWHVACLRNHSSVVEMLLQATSATTCLRTHNRKGMAPLHSACTEGCLEAAQLLLAFEQAKSCPEDHVALVNLPCSTARQTPLHYASSTGHSHVVELLLHSPSFATLNAGSHTGQTALHLAAIRNHVDVVRALLAAPGIQADAPDLEGQTPLHLACEHGSAEVAELLLGTPGVNINALTNHGKSPLYLALWCNPSAPNRQAKLATAWLLLSSSQPLNVAQPDTMSSYTALHWACDVGDVAIVQRLLDVGAPINHLSVWGTVPLQGACCGCHVEVVELLLKHPGFMPNAEEGVKCLRAACTNGSLPLAKLLVEHIPGMDLNCPNIWGNAAIHHACQSGNVELVKWLLGCEGLDVNAVGEAASTVLHSSTNGGSELAQVLLDAGCTHINSRDQEGHTPLHRACMHNRASVARVLLGAPRVDINAKNNYNRTPLHEACRSGSIAALRELLGLPGLDLRAEDDAGRIPWMLLDPTSRQQVADLFGLIGEVISSFRGSLAAASMS